MEKLKIEYSRALIDYIGGKENAIKKIKTLALNDNLALITLNRINHVDSLKINEATDDTVFLKYSKDFNKSRYADLPVKLVTGEGNVLIYNRDSSDVTYSIMEFKSSGGFIRIFYFVEIDPGLIKIDPKKNIFVNEFQYGPYRILKNHCKSYDFYTKILDGKIERALIDFN
jgi:hypothetical protein